MDNQHNCDTSAYTDGNLKNADNLQSYDTAANTDGNMKKILRNVVIILVAVMALGLFWRWSGNRSDYSPASLVVDPFVLYIPVVIITVGLVFFIVSLFVDKVKSKRALKITAICVAAFGVAFSVSSFVVFSHTTADTETKIYKEYLDEKFNVANYIDMDGYVQDDIYKGNNVICSIGDLSGYFNAESYSQSEASRGSIYVESYEYSGGTKLYRNIIKKRLENSYLSLEKDLSGKRIKYVDGTTGDYRYRYCCYTEKDNYWGNETKFTVIADGNDKIILYRIMSDYKHAFGPEISPEQIIDKLCD